MKGINLLRNHTQKIFSLKNIFSRIHVKPLWLNLFSHSPRTFNTITIFFPKTSMKFLIHDWFQTPLVLVLALFSSLFTAVPSVQCRDEEKLCIKVNKRKLSNKIRHNYRLLWGTFYFYFRPIPQSQLFTSKIKKNIFRSLSPSLLQQNPKVPVLICTEPVCFLCSYDTPEILLLKYFLNRGLLIGVVMLTTFV